MKDLKSLNEAGCATEIMEAKDGPSLEITDQMLADLARHPRFGVEFMRNLLGELYDRLNNTEAGAVKLVIREGIHYVWTGSMGQLNFCDNEKQIMKVGKEIGELLLEIVNGCRQERDGGGQSGRIGVITGGSSIEELSKRDMTDKNMMDVWKMLMNMGFNFSVCTERSGDIVLTGVAGGYMIRTWQDLVTNYGDLVTPLAKEQHAKIRPIIIITYEFRTNQKGFDDWLGKIFQFPENIKEKLDAAKDNEFSGKLEIHLNGEKINNLKFTFRLKTGGYLR